MAKGIVELGNIEGKEYYLDLNQTIEDEKGIVIPNPSYQQVVWRVPDIREAIIAEPGFLILSADYAQIEVKLMAHLSRDPVLIAAINSGKDIHSFNATEVFGSVKHFDYETLEIARKDKFHARYAELVKIRNDIKTVTFGVPYGAGKNKVALMTGMPADTDPLHPEILSAGAFIEAFFAKFSVLGAWLEQSGSDAIKYGFSSSPRGRRRFYELPSDSAKEKERDKIYSQIRRFAGNHPIQAGNVDMLKPAMYKIYKDLRDLGLSDRQARILFCVHDEVVTTCILEDGLRRTPSGIIIPLSEFDVMPKEDKKKTVPGPVEHIMKHRMQESYDEIIPDIINRIDVGIGPAWEKA